MATLDGTDEPVLVYLTGYRVLCAGQDPRAQDILTAGYNILQEQAAKIGDERLRRSFLENVAAHRELVAAWTNAESQGMCHRTRSRSRACQDEKAEK